MEKMKAARLFSIGDFRTTTVNVPEPKGNELLVRIGACGVCGSDLPRIYEHGTSSGVYPLTLGHEFAGTIVKVGEAADPDLIGKRGAFFPLIPCRECDSCITGNYAMCSNYDYMGSRCDGGFAEYCLVPSKWHFIESKNPEISFETLAMTEPACVAQHSIRKARVTAGEKVVVFGSGPIGIMAGRWARLFGADVLLVDVVDDKVDFARAHGFDCINSRKDGFIDSVREYFGGTLVDVAIEGTGFSSALENAINVLKPFGRITLMGNPAGNTTISQKAHSTILRKELEINGMWNSHFCSSPINEWEYTISCMDKKTFFCDDLVSHSMGLDELPSFIEKMHKKEVVTCKVLYKA